MLPLRILKLYLMTNIFGFEVMFFKVGNNGTKHLLYSQKRQTSRACKY